MKHRIIFQGTTIQFDCSFDEVGPYNRDIDIEWDCMRIDSVSVVPDDVGQVEAIYSATSTSLTEVCSCIHHSVVCSRNLKLFTAMHIVVACQYSTLCVHTLVVVLTFTNCVCTCVGAVFCSV